MSPLTPEFETLISHAVAEANSRQLRDILHDRAENVQSGVASDAKPSDGSGISPHRLWAYLNRSDDAPIEFDIERALRSDSAIRDRAARMLESNSFASTDMAMAAASGTFHVRTIGQFKLQVIESADSCLLVLAPKGKASRTPTILEALGKAGHVRIRLPLPVRGHIQIPLTHDSEDLVALDALLRAPDTNLFLR